MRDAGAVPRPRNSEGAMRAAEGDEAERWQGGGGRRRGHRGWGVRSDPRERRMAEWDALDKDVTCIRCNRGWLRSA
eukprot:2228038-Rhodomonas_salina.2